MPIPITRTAFRISEGEEEFFKLKFRRNWGGEGIYDWKSEGMGNFTGGISGAERVE